MSKFISLVCSGLIVAGAAGGASATESRSCQPFLEPARAHRTPAPLQNLSPTIGSRLYSWEDRRLQVGTLLQDPAVLALVLQQAAGSEQALLASVEERRNATRISWNAVDAGNPVETLKTRLSSLERLYVIVFRRNQANSFSLALNGANPHQGPTVSAGEVLRQLAFGRECIARQLIRGAGVTPLVWRMASIAPRPFGGAHRAAVKVRAVDADGRPLAGVIAFGRGVHLDCTASIDKSGIAGCTLVDSHGHEVEPGEFNRPTVASFPGQIGKDFVIPPISLVVR